ncbi:DUF2306 domain-containing protein [Brevibacillus sp. B_LB10_24]|uniref:DUF2306 domain-containing protein n=1 Tax=Brevibacillus sp. B_LB10_24 TaxID=3380645 RepID=UPI0038BA346D
MSLFDTMLLMHIAAGSICLVAGALAAGVKKRKGVHTVSGEIYHGAYVVIFITSAVMAVLNWSKSGFLLYVAIFSYGLALLGYLARKQRWKNWLASHIGGMLGSYIGVITAILVVNGENMPLISQIPSLWLWFLPTIIGTPIISFVGRRYTKSNKSDKTL